MAAVIVFFIAACSGTEKNQEMLKLSYRNINHGFALTFPEKWLSYRVFEKMDITGPNTVVPSLYFALPTRSRNWQPVHVPEKYAGLFIIRIFTAAEWNRFYSGSRSGSEPVKRSDIILHQGKGRVFLLVYSTSIPIDLYIYMDDISSIAGSFRLLEE